jgi:membrane protein DedA with SNARE-associated domain
VLLAPVAGLTRMPFPRFLACDAVGCLVWAGAFILIGYSSGVSLEVMQQNLQVVSVGVQVVIAAALGAWLITRVAVRRRRTA